MAVIGAPRARWSRFCQTCCQRQCWVSRRAERARRPGTLIRWARRVASRARAWKREARLPADAASGAPDPLPPPRPQAESYSQPPRTALGEQLLLLALLLPPAALIGLLVMHAVERRLDDAGSRPGRVSSSDLSWQSSAQARAHRLRRPSPDTHTSAG